MVSDSQLIKRARYGGRNLAGLAILVSFGAVCTTLAMFAPAGDIIKWFAASISLMAAAYWALAVAARHGDPRAIAVVMAFLSIQLLINSVAFVFAFLRSSGSININILWLIIPIAIIAALYRNRADLLELK